MVSSPSQGPSRLGTHPASWATLPNSRTWNLSMGRSVKKSSTRLSDWPRAAPWSAVAARNAPVGSARQIPTMVIGSSAGVEADAHISALANQTPSWRARNGGWRAGCSKSRGGSFQGYLERGARPRSIGARNPREIGAVVSLVATACTALVAHSHAPTKRTSPSAGRSMRARRGLARGVGAFRRQHTPRFPSNG